MGPITTHTTAAEVIVEKTEPDVEINTVEIAGATTALVTHPINGPMLKARRTARARAERQSSLPLDRFFRFCVNAPPVLSILLLVLITSIPFAVMMGVAYGARNRDYIGDPSFHGSWKRLSRWLITVWASVVLVIPLTFGGAAFGSWLCRQSLSGRRYAPLARTVAVRLIFLISAGAAHQAAILIFPVTWLNDPYNWTFTLRQALKFLVIAFTIIFVQGVVLSLASIQYIGGYVGPRSQTSMGAVNTLQNLNNLVKPHVGKRDIGIIKKVLAKLFLPRKPDLFNDIRSGVCTKGQIRDYSAKIWDQLSEGRPTIRAVDISTRLVAMGRDPEPAYDLFLQLDESNDGEVTREEFEGQVMRTSSQLRKRADAMYGIRILLRKLEFILTLIMFGVIVFVYTIFFGQTWAKDVGALWTGIVALSFAFSAPVAELVNSCMFVFAKHAYDVGDTVEIKENRLIVSRIYLTHTNFEEARDDGENPKVVQWSHSALTAEAIVNLTRSHDLAEMAKMEENY